MSRYVMGVGSKPSPGSDKKAPCAVLSVMNAFGLSEEDAVRICKNYGYKPNVGQDYLKFSRMLTDYFKAKLVGVFGSTSGAKYMWKVTPKENSYKGMSLKTFLSLHQHGTYVLIVFEHFTVVKDGKLVDNGCLKAGTSVIAAWKAQVDVDTI